MVVVVGWYTVEGQEDNEGLAGGMRRGGKGGGMTGARGGGV